MAHLHPQPEAIAQAKEAAKAQACKAVVQDDGDRDLT
jgi:hypothetical protein